MYKLILFFIVLLLTRIDSVAQTQFKDFIIADKYIWALTSDGRIMLFDTANGKPASKQITNTSGIFVLATDAYGIPVIADSANEIKRYNAEKKSWDVITNYSEKLYGLIFNKKNSCYAITQNGIADMRTKQVYFPQDTAIFYRKTWSKVPVYMIDKSDNIWVGFGFGEWGGAIYVFNTREEKYIDTLWNNSEFSVSPVKSFFEDSIAVYFTSGLSHMFVVSGSISKYENQKFRTIFYNTSEYSKDGKFKLEKEGEYIGPGAYNSFDHSIYFYSQHGIFKGDIKKDLSKFENWINVIETKLKWGWGQSDATGPPMNVTKLSIIDKDKFAILTEKDGIGLFDGARMIMIQ